MTTAALRRAAERLDAAKQAQAAAADEIAAALIDTGRVPLGYREVYRRARRDVWFARTAYLKTKRPDTTAAAA